MDTHFRLLREDVTRPLRRSLALVVSQLADAQQHAGKVKIDAALRQGGRFRPGGGEEGCDLNVRLSLLITVP